jgi:hypothetical protein
MVKPPPKIEREPREPSEQYRVRDETIDFDQDLYQKKMSYNMVSDKEIEEFKEKVY